MKNSRILFTACLLCLGLSSAAQNTKMLIAGSGWNKITIIDKASGKTEWQHSIGDNDECNAAIVAKGGDILFSYKNGASLIRRDGKVIWDYKVTPGSEVQHVSASRKGYILGICGHPARIVELDGKGREKDIIAFETGIKDPHGQFRRIWAKKDGTYMIPLISTNEIVTVDRQGKVIKRIRTDYGAFAVRESSNGNLLISEGDNHSFSFATPDGKVTRRIAQKDIPGINLGYVALIDILENGNMLICNWLGHGSDESQPHIIEVDPGNRVVWSYNDKTDKHARISSAFQFEQKGR